MLEMAEKSGRDFRAGFMGRTMTVLWEEVKNDNLWTGYTGNYIKVIAKSADSLANCLTDTRLAHEFEGALWGRIESGYK